MERSQSYVSISSLLKRLSTKESTKNVKAEEVAAALGLVFTNSLSPVQFGLLLWALHVTEGDHHPKVLTACAQAMREAAAQVDETALIDVVQRKARPEGLYGGGLCDIVGTGGDGHNTFNVSTTSSIIASALLLMAKHGNNSSTSLSGSADLLLHTPQPPILTATTSASLPAIYEKTNYAFLYAREWHPGMKHAATVRREVPVRTIFNLLGPLSNPLHDTGLVECRILGVARAEIGPNFAEALRLASAKKALVVCGDEDLDEVSPAGPTHCWYIREEGTQVDITKLTITPEDFGLERHALGEVHGGKGPKENAGILMRILRNELHRGDPVLDFVLINTAALLTVSGICEANGSSMGEGDDGRVVQERGPGGLRWKEGLRRARWCIESGAALKQWESFVEVTNEVAGLGKGVANGRVG